MSNTVTRRIFTLFGVLLLFAFAHGINEVVYIFSPDDGFGGSREAKALLYRNIAHHVLFALNLVALFSLSCLFIYQSADKRLELIVNEISANLKKIRRPILRSGNKALAEKVSTAFHVMALTRVRLLDYIGSLRERNILNLWFGTIPVFIAIAMLILFLLTFDLKMPWRWEDENGTRHDIYIMIFTIVFIQSFSLFFLRMFSKTLTDIKYYQNELSNVEMKISSLIVAQTYEDTDLISTILTEIAKSERNFVLQKDEKVVQSETAQPDVSTQGLLEIIKKLVGAGA